MTQETTMNAEPMPGAVILPDPLADADAPDSLTPLVREVAIQDAATPEQVAELVAALDGWLDKGDTLDRNLRDAVSMSHHWTTDGLPGEREQLAWCEDDPSVTADYLAEVREDFAKAEREELEERQSVAAHCAAMVEAGEHGTDGRELAVMAEQDREWSSIVD